MWVCGAATRCPAQVITMLFSAWFKVLRSSPSLRGECWGGLKTIAGYGAVEPAAGLWEADRGWNLKK